MVSTSLVSWAAKGEGFSSRQRLSDGIANQRASRKTPSNRTITAQTERASVSEVAFLGPSPPVTAVTLRQYFSEGNRVRFVF